MVMIGVDRWGSRKARRWAAGGGIRGFSLNCRGLDGVYMSR